MTRMQPECVRKYCEPLDRFLKIRKFNPAQIEELLSGADIPNKTAFQQFIISACLVDYSENVLPLIKEQEEDQSTGAREQVEESLYEICIKVNPRLALDRVTLPVDETEQNDLHIFSPDTEESPLEDLSFLEEKEEELSNRVVGQEEAVNKVSRALKRAFVGFRNPDRPIGTFLFVGQTGVGKTELAKVVADLYFENASSMVRVDCSEYALPHETAKLTGAPPGYVGYGEGSYLMESLKQNSESVVLFDEVEKANARVHNLLLQVLDEGFMTDSEGTKVRFNNSLVILTSNLGVSYIERLKDRMGFDFHSERGLDRDQLKDETFNALRDEFPPEFIGRINDIVLFNPLSIQDCVKIVDQVLEEVKKHIQQTDLELEVTRPARKHLAETGYSRRYGAREIRSTVIQKIEDPLSEKLINGQIDKGDRVKVRLRNNQLRFHRN